MIVQEDVPYTKEEVKAMVKTIHDMREKLSLLGWHPASELPPEEGEYIAISLPDMYGSTDIFYAEYRQLYGWCYEIEGHYAKINIQKWCYPPGKEK